jgi:hypothetical protein
VEELAAVVAGELTVAVVEEPAVVAAAPGEVPVAVPGPSGGSHTIPG